MNSLELSIIVPAYNAEKFIDRCLDSLLMQDLSTDEYEIIVVNDGSQDGTRDILEVYSGKYPQIHCFHTLNQGVSMARNWGIDQASGEYILFVDSDDAIRPYALKDVYNHAVAEGLDILVMDYSLWADDGEIEKEFDYTKRCEKDAVTVSGIDFMKSCLPPVVWSVLYRLDYWREYNFRFLPIRHEDEELIPRVFFFAEKVRFLPLDFYYYYQNQDSFMMNYNENAAFNMLQAMESLNAFRQIHVQDSSMNVFFENLIARKLLQGFKDSIRFNCPIEVQEKLIWVMKEKGLSPVPQSKSGVHKWLYNKTPSLFIAYYRLKLRHRGR